MPSLNNIPKSEYPVEDLLRHIPFNKPEEVFWQEFGLFYTSITHMLESRQSISSFADSNCRNLINLQLGLIHFLVNKQLEITAADRAEMDAIQLNHSFDPILEEAFSHLDKTVSLINSAVNNKTGLNERERMLFLANMQLSYDRLCNDLVLHPVMNDDLIQLNLDFIRFNGWTMLATHIKSVLLFNKDIELESSRINDISFFINDTWQNLAATANLLQITSKKSIAGFSDKTIQTPESLQEDEILAEEGVQEWADEIEW